MINAKYLPEDESLNIEFETQNIVEPTTDRSLKNIKKTLIYSLRREYKLEDIDKINDIADKILKIHGLHKDNFDFVKQADIAIQENINDFSIDDNSNKSDKNPKSVIHEVTAPIHKLIGYDYLYQIMRELYSKKEAKRLSGLMYDYSLALADTTNILLPYCWSMDASRLITEGKRFGQLESSNSKRVDSYVSTLNEVIHTMSNNLAGAIAIGTFFLDIAHLSIYKNVISITKLKEDRATQKMIENQYQQIVHGLNSLSRNGGTESPFTNISMLDRSKLATVLNDDNGYFDMLFGDNKHSVIFQETSLDIKDKEGWRTYVIEYIMELQNIFMKFFDKGDPLTDGMPYRFPVVTLNLGKSYKQDKGWTIEDKIFLKAICKKDVFRYNIFVSEGTKFASCCFRGDEVITIQDEQKNETKVTLQKFVSHYIHTPEGQQIISDNVYINSMNPETYTNELVKITGVLKKKNPYSQLVRVAINNSTICVTPDHLFKVKSKVTGEIQEIEAIKLIDNFRDYLIHCEV